MPRTSSISSGTKELRKSGRRSTRRRSKPSFDSRSHYNLGRALDGGAPALWPSWRSLSRPSTLRHLKDEATSLRTLIRLAEQGSPAVLLGSGHALRRTAWVAGSSPARTPSSPTPVLSQSHSIRARGQPDRSDVTGSIIQKSMLSQCLCMEWMTEISNLSCISIAHKGVSALPPEAPRGAKGARIKVSAKFARNPLKRLISDERIQGNTSFSNPA